jgi:hypothetical protein
VTLFDRLGTSVSCKFHIFDNVGVASVPGVRWLVVMTDFLLFSIRQKGQRLNIRYRERVRRIKIDSEDSALATYLKI